MDLFEVGQSYRVKGEKKIYVLKKTSTVSYCGVFVCEDGHTHTLELNNMQLADKDVEKTIRK